MKDNAGAALSVISETSASADGEKSLISVREKTDPMTLRESRQRKLFSIQSKKLNI